jgi:hypothetical protein
MTTSISLGIHHLLESVETNKSTFWIDLNLLGRWRIFFEHLPAFLELLAVDVSHRKEFGSVIRSQSLRSRSRSAPSTAYQGDPDLFAFL